MEEKHRFTKGFICGILASFAVVAAVVLGNKVLQIDNLIFQRSSDNLSSSDVMSKVNAIQEVIDREFLDEYQAEDLEAGIYKGFLSGLGDPYSTYYTTDEVASLMEQTEGSYSGIGAALTQNIETGASTVVQVYEGSPAMEAGMLEGDVLYKVDDEDVTVMDLTDIVGLLKGETGTDVEVTVLRGDKYKEETFTVTRGEVEIPTVTSDMLEDGIGYIKVSEFDNVTTQQYISAIEQLEAAGMERLVVDLRNNPGGNVSTVCDMLDYMIDEGVLVYTEDKYENRVDYKTETKGGFDKPVVVLVNGNSASASEIYAGAMQDYDKAVLVGTTTYGKGIVQKIISLKDGSAIKLTYSKYFTPEGRDIHTKGIEPDYEVELDDSITTMTDLEYQDDNQLQKAIEVIKER